MAGCSNVLILLTVSLVPYCLPANDWESREFNGISVKLPTGSKKRQGKLRSMPDNTQWITYEVQVPIEVARYHASICTNGQDLSLSELASSFAKAESRYQKNVFKRSNNPSLRSTKTFTRTSKIRIGKHQGWKSAEFTIEVEFEVPSIGFGTVPIRSQCGQIDVRLVESEKGVIALVREQYLGPFNKSFLARRFFRSLVLSDHGGRSK